MQRVASVKSVLLEKKDSADDDMRSPESVERVWTDEVDGAWAQGKAPVHLLTALLQHVQDDDVAQAELTARAILEVEPQNQLVQDLIDAMKQREQLDATLESASESESDDEEEDDEASGESNDDDSADAASGDEDDTSGEQDAPLASTKDAAEDKNNDDK